MEYHQSCDTCGRPIYSRLSQCRHCAHYRLPFSETPVGFVCAGASIQVALERGDSLTYHFRGPFSEYEQRRMKNAIMEALG